MQSEWKAKMEPEYKEGDKYYAYYMVASEPVRVTMRIFDGKPAKVGAEILDADKNHQDFKRDGTFLTDIDNNNEGEVREIDKATFDRFVTSIQASGKLPPIECRYEGE